MIELEERVSRYLSRMEPSVQGQGGSSSAYKVACVLTQGFDLDEETAFQLFLLHFNPRCTPPWSDGEVRHKIKDASTAPSGKPRGYLLKTPSKTPGGQQGRFTDSFRKPTIAECKDIAKGRGLHGYGAAAAAELGVLRVGVWRGTPVWSCVSAGGPVVELRRIDNQPFPSFGTLAERKTHTLKGASKKRPVGFIPGIGKACPIALCEGLPNLLALWDQVVWESSIVPVGGNPFNLGGADIIRRGITCLPLAILSSGLSIAEETLDWYRERHVRVFVDNDDPGRKAAERWNDQLRGVAGEVSFFNCGEALRRHSEEAVEPGADFNDCFQPVAERVLP